MEATNETEDKISFDLEEQYTALEKYAHNQSPEEVIQVRRQQVAIARLLVKVHQRHTFIAVKSITNLGEAYLEAKYHQQAAEHLKNTLKMNAEIINDSEDTKQHYSRVATLLSQCHMENEKPDEAQRVLEKSYETNKEAVGEEDFSNCNICAMMAKVYLKKKMYKEAIEKFMQAEKFIADKYGDNSLELAAVYSDLANAYDKSNEHENAIEYQQKAIGIYKQAEVDPLLLISSVTELSEIYERADDFDKAVETLREVASIYKDALKDNKKCCKVKKRISILLIKDNKYQDALIELEEIQKVEIELYGKKSVQIGKNCKAIGTLYIVIKDEEAARKYLGEAYRIFEAKGLEKLKKEVIEKMRSISDSIDLYANDTRDNPALRAQDDPVKVKRKPQKRRIKK